MVVDDCDNLVPLRIVLRRVCALYRYLRILVHSYQTPEVLKKPERVLADE